MLVYVGNRQVFLPAMTEESKIKGREGHTIIVGYIKEYCDVMGLDFIAEIEEDEEDFFELMHFEHIDRCPLLLNWGDKTQVMALGYDRKVFKNTHSALADSRVEEFLEKAEIRQKEIEETPKGDKKAELKLIVEVFRLNK